MKKIILTLAFVVLTVSSAFSYSWVLNSGDWYVYDEDNGEAVSNTLIDVGDNVYYLDRQGKMVTGWWTNEGTGKVYFFDNNTERNYGGMVFGLHTVDGYYRYFGDDGSLQSSDEEGTYKKVYLEFWADYDGRIYFNNVLMRDTTTAKSEYYTNTAYYTDKNLNNFYLANYDKVVEPTLYHTSTSPSGGFGPAITDLERDKNGSGSEKSSASRTAGGADYYVDNMGHVIVADKTGNISDFEKLGPMIR